MGPSQNYFQNWLNLHWVKLAKENLTKSGFKTGYDKTGYDHLRFITNTRFTFNYCPVYIQQQIILIQRPIFSLNFYSTLVQFSFNELFFSIQRILRNTWRGL